MLILPKSKLEVSRILSNMQASSNGSYKVNEFSVVERLTLLITALKNSIETEKIEFGDKFYRKINRLKLDFKLKRYELESILFTQDYIVISSTYRSLTLKHRTKGFLLYVGIGSSKSSSCIIGMSFKTDKIKATFIQLLRDIKKR